LPAALPLPLAEPSVCPCAFPEPCPLAEPSFMPSTQSADAVVDSAKKVMVVIMLIEIGNFI
jgi:hypothetical protein